MTDKQLNEKIDILLNCVANNLDFERTDEYATGIKKSPPLLNTIKAKQQLLQLIYDTCVGVINNKDAMILSKQLPYFDSIEQYSEYLRNIRDKLRTEQLSKLNKLVKGE